MPESSEMFTAHNQLVDLLSDAQNAADEINAQMLNIAETIPEYKILRNMNGLGDRLSPIIPAEIGDIRRSRARTATFQSVAVPPSEKLVLRSCRHSN